MANTRGKGRVFKRGRRWWIAYYASDHGRSIEVRESGGESEKDALALLEERRLAVAAHRRGVARFDPGSERVTLVALALAVVETMEVKGRVAARTDRSRLQHLDAFFGFVKAAAVTDELVEAYVEERRTQGASDKTIDHELSLIRRAYRRPGAPPGPRVPMLTRKHANARRGFLTAAQYHRLVAALPKDETDFRDLLDWFWITGMRPSEIARLRWTDVDGDTVRLAADDAKTGRVRVIPLVPQLARIIKRRRAARNGDFVFHIKGRMAVAKAAGFPKREMKLWHAACRVAGLDGTIPYDLRRCAIRNLRAAGVPERVAMEISGHTSRATFDRYGIVDDRDLRAALRRVSA